MAFHIHKTILFFLAIQLVVAVVFFGEMSRSLVGVPNASMAVVISCLYCICSWGGSKDGW